jgi:urocanate hydratase
MAHDPGTGSAPIGDVSDLWRDEFQGAPTGTDLRCRSWPQEGILRLLNNNLDPEVAEDPEDLVVYGGTGRAARSWEAYEAIVAELEDLGDRETLLVQSGKPVGVFRTHDRAPRVLVANSHLVPRWANWDRFHDLEAQGLMMYGQMTAGSWAYIGTQGIIQGTFETLAELARREWDGTLQGRLVLTAGLGGMGGAQPLAVTMNEGVCLAVEVDEARVDRRVDDGYCMEKATDLDEALDRVETAREAGEAHSVGLVGNAAETHPALVDRGIVPDVVTDQTSAHDELDGYVPAGHTLEEAQALRAEDPGTYRRQALDSMRDHVEAMLAMQGRGAVAFEYGNNLRGQVADQRDLDEAFDIPGFVPAYVRPMFCEGRGPFRWLALTGDEADIAATDEAILDLFPDDDVLRRWIRLASEQVPYQGLPARVCWLGYGEREEAALRFNEMVAEGTMGPVAVTRDHLDSGSVASPNRETEDMKDGSDAVADWPLLNAMLNTSAGAHLVALHHGGGVGMGYSIHAGMTVVLDGSEGARERAERVFEADPGTGVARHADAGYERARTVARDRELDIPMLDDAGDET